MISNGFFMLQESVYCRLVQNSTAAEFAIENVKRNKPDAGIVQMLRVTEKQYQNMEYAIGEARHDVLDTDERLVII